MAYYKIKNITQSLAKRDANKDKILNIKYNIGFIEKNYSLPVGQEMIISCTNLPTTIQSLRLKGFVTVREISENEFLKNQRPNAKKQVPTPVRKKPAVKKVTKKPIAKKVVETPKVEEAQ